MDQNIIWQNRKVTYEDRIDVLKQKGLVVWFTGLSGSGKTTIAMELEKKLNQDGRAVYLLDGDNIRHGINSDLGFSDADRNENIRRIAEIAALFQDAGVITLVSFISPFQEMRDFAKQKAGSDNFMEVYISADLKTCSDRDPKGLYKKQINNFTGISSPYEIPENPALIVDTQMQSIEESVAAVYELILERI